MRERDIDIVKHIAEYCNDIAESIARFGNTLDVPKVTSTI